MTYVKLEHRGLDNDRWLDITPEAFTVHVWALDYCNEQRTDGLIPARRAQRLVCPVDPADITEAWSVLFKVGIWEQTEDGYLCPEFLAYGFPADQQTALQDRWASDKRRVSLCKNGVHMLCTERSNCPVVGRRSGANSTSSGTGSPKSGRLDQTRPDPTRPQGREGEGNGDGDGSRSAIAAHKPRPGEETPHVYVDDGKGKDSEDMRCLCGQPPWDQHRQDLHWIVPHPYVETPGSGLEPGDMCAVCGRGAGNTEYHAQDGAA